MLWLLSVFSFVNLFQTDAQLHNPRERHIKRSLTKGMKKHHFLVSQTMPLNQNDDRKEKERRKEELKKGKIGRREKKDT